ncbi:response regulator transcription factor [Nitrosomonas ureae]|uniref:DNA-binding response regulator, NarL/FixJ family, contains REC and HTH domains n=1 Tax=Nitrosomonas ureae TaxID=44577 RepID=A0A1H5WUR7_9PROT|nr:DNA-binding response regulator [Nitrosomonas ureae]SEG03198.1 DNA-binding response regulator, NarL/FixJ family, contains REC and HTH domains [Nitrosomonas ureae]
MNKKIKSTLERISHSRAEVPRVLILIHDYISGGDLEYIVKGWEFNIIGIYNSNKAALFRVKIDKPDLILTDMELDDDSLCVTHQFNLLIGNSKLCVYFTSYTTQSIMQRTMTLVSALGNRVQECSNERSCQNAESDFNRHDDGIDKSLRLAKLSSPNPIRVLLVDDQQIVLLGLEKLINSQKPKMEVVGSAENIFLAKRLIMEKRPDVLILNIYLGDINCVNHISEFANNGDTKIVIFCRTRDQEVIDQAVLFGARGIVYQKESIQTILKVIKKVHDGELWFDRETASRTFLQNFHMRKTVSPSINTRKISALTRKECEILKVFSQANGSEQNKQIAAHLQMSEYTLRNHLSAIFKKLGINNRFGLFMYARRHFRRSGSSINKVLQ